MVPTPLFITSKKERLQHLAHRIQMAKHWLYKTEARPEEGWYEKQVIELEDYLVRVGGQLRRLEKTQQVNGHALKLGIDHALSTIDEDISALMAQVVRQQSGEAG